MDELAKRGGVLGYPPVKADIYCDAEFIVGVSPVSHCSKRDTAQDIVDMVKPDTRVKAMNNGQHESRRDRSMPTACT